MRHRVKGRRLGRASAHRQALLMNLSKSLIKHRGIRTTLAKAKELRGFIEPLITRAKVNTLHNRRVLLSRLGGDNHLVEKLLTDIGPAFKARPGGYTRIYKLADARAGDGAEMALIQLVGLFELAQAVLPEEEEEETASTPESKSDESKSS